MSFSKDIKEELSKLNNLANKKEVKYEFLGYFSSNNIVEEKNLIKYSTENDYNIDRFAKIIINVKLMYINAHNDKPTIPVINPAFPTLLPTFLIDFTPKTIDNIPVGILI